MIAGRYALVREVGRGGMGTVWLAEDTLLGRRVALKRIGLLPGADGPDLERAEREARLAAQLSHPHVVTVFNLVVDPGTQERWLVMEHVDGTNLARLLREEGALAPDDAAPLLAQVADALVAAHAVGIVHRDVKPSNVLVDRRRQAMLADFGIARTAADPVLTRTGLLTGSPAYLAPEVAAGERGDESADVWSLGATVFHVLAGRPPYDAGDNVLGTLVRIVNEEPPRLPDAGWMAPLLAATMAKDPRRRWTMEQVRDFLVDPQARAALAPEADPDRTQLMAPLAASPASAATPPAEPGPPRSASPSGPAGRLGRTPVVLAVVGLALAVVLGVALAAVLLGGEPPTEDAVAEVPAGAGSSAPPEASPASDEKSESRRRERPSERGMERFARSYVDAVAAEPARSWRMLTPKFQRESGGFERYRTFWSGVGEPELLDVTADPRALVVSYRVRFENFGTGRRPTVLQLVHHDGGYRIDGELTEGFEPAG